LPACLPVTVAHDGSPIKRDRGDQGFVTAVRTSFDRLLAGMVAAGQGLEAICLYLGLTQAAVFANVVRLGLPSPSDRPYRRPGPRGWSVLDTTRLIVWRLAGVHPETIGLRLGRSASAVRAKARRLGIPAPPRSSLRRLDPQSLADPEPGAFRGLVDAADGLSGRGAADLCGRTAGPVSIRGGAGWPSRDPAPASISPLPLPAPAVQTEDSAPSARKIRAHGLERPTDQRELPLLQVVGSAPRVSETPDAVAECRPAVVDAPQSEAEVELGGDLRWVGQVAHPLQSEVAVWAASMLYLGGLHWKQIAKRIGKTVGATRSLLSRAELPRDPDRRKFSDRFDERAARATLAASGYEVAQDRESKRCFWRHKTDRATVRRDRQYRLEHDLVERYSRQSITLITAADLALQGAA